MEEMFKNPPTPFSKGISLKELMTSSGSEFHIDMDFKKKSNGMMMNGDDDVFPDMDDQDDSDSDDVLKSIEESAQKKLLSAPEYLSFETLAPTMVDVLPSGDVKMTIIEEGEGPLVPTDAEVTLHYAAYWEKGTIPFDTTLTMNFGEPLRLLLGSGRCLPGLEIGLTAIRGPTARFYLLLQPRVAWGERGVMPRIKPEPALFVIVLYDVKDMNAGARFNSLPREEQTKFKVTMSTVKSIHAKAKDLFTKKKYPKAISDYQQSISVLNISQPENKDQEEEVKKLKVNALLNLAVCYTKINRPKLVLQMLENLDYLMDVDKHCKALFYFGKANELLGKTDLAIEYYQKALKIEPKNKDIGKALDSLDTYLKNSAKKEKEMWQHAFKGETKEKFDVDEEFQNGVQEMFNELAEKNEYATFELPPGLSSDEVDYVKYLANKLEGTIIHEEGEGRRRKVTIVKKV